MVAQAHSVCRSGITRPDRSRKLEENALSKIVPEERARQGRRGRHVFVILVVALVLAAIGWFVVEQYGKSIADQPTQLDTAG